MTAYNVNSLLLKKLSNIINISGTQMANMCCIWPSTLNRYLSGQKPITIEALVQLCNKLRIPAWYFITIDGTALFPPKEQLVLPADTFQPVRWATERVDEIFGERKGQIHWAEVAESIGVFPNKPSPWFHGKVRFTLQRYLEICEGIQLDPFLLLDDPNRPENLHSGGPLRPSQPDPQLSTSPNELAVLRTQVTTMKSAITALQSEVSALRASLNKVLASLPLLKHPSVIYELPDAELPMAAENEDPKDL